MKTRRQALGDIGNRAQEQNQQKNVLQKKCARTRLFSLSYSRSVRFVPNFCSFHRIRVLVVRKGY